MNTSEILTSIQTQLVTSMGINEVKAKYNVDLKDATTFYNDLISEMPFHESIDSFLLGVNTNSTSAHGASNLTIITFDHTVSEEEKELHLIGTYLDEKLNTGHDYVEWKFLGNHLIIAFDF